VSPLGGVAGRLALALLAVVAGVLTIVYLIVVPSYQSSLTGSELRSLKVSMRSVAIPNFPAQPWAKQLYAETWSPRVNARIVVYDVLTPAQLEPVADSSPAGSTDVENDPVVQRAHDREALANGSVTRNGATYAEAAAPVGASVVLLSAPL
jgi:hypothetical protein